MTKLDIIILVSACWRFDDNQQPMSSWHDKQYLLKRLESDLDEMTKDEIEKFNRFYENDPDRVNYYLKQTK